MGKADVRKIKDEWMKLMNELVQKAGMDGLIV